MSWFDDAKKKAQDTADDAKEKAAQEAGKAALSAATGAATKAVGSFFEGIVSSAEESLAEAQEARGRTGEENPVFDEAETLAEEEEAAEEAGPTLEQRLAKMRRAQRAEQAAPPSTTDTDTASTAPEPVVLPEVSRVPEDPMAKAMAALEAARRARGAPDDAPAPVVPTDSRGNPLDAASAALARAAEARALVQSGGRRALEREAAAREQLEAMRAGLSGRAAPIAPDPDSDDQPVSPPSPKKRTL